MQILKHTLYPLSIYFKKDDCKPNTTLRPLTIPRKYFNVPSIASKIKVTTKGVTS